MSFRKLFGWSRRGVVSFLRGALAAGVFGALIWPAHAAPSPIAHWAFQAVTDPKLPVVTNSAWCRTALDRFILQKLETDGIRPVPEATRNALIRRVSFDLTGLPPSAESTERFETDLAPEAYERLVDRLLASPQYGERWGRHWLDVVRYADTAGETADYPVPVAWRYRNYVIDAFNTDKPYSTFLREQVAGDILARTGPRERYAEQVTATGFLALSRRFGFDSENYHHLTLQDTIDTLGQAALGLTLGCARCHAHKFDPISLEDYYGLYGIFESTRYAFPGSEQKQRYRALTPLIPLEESHLQWVEFEQRVASLSSTLRRIQRPVPSAVLRSSDELDGDFEMQAPAAGGSNGVLVPPWVYQGLISVSTEAQSPFRHLHPTGRVGVRIESGTNGFQIRQALYLSPQVIQQGLLHTSFDFRIKAPTPTGRVPHRFWIGDSVKQPALELLLFPGSVSLRVDGKEKSLGSLETGVWQTVQLTLDLKTRTVSGHLGHPGKVLDFGPLAVSSSWNGRLAEFGVDSKPLEGAIRDQIDLDNIAASERPLPPVSTEFGVQSVVGDDLERWSKQVADLTGIDGDFELQSQASSLTTPWKLGPKGAVKIQATSQSPFQNVYSQGQQGLNLPNTSSYNGFDQLLSRPWKADQTNRLEAGFDFRCAEVTKGGDGAWRIYFGHGPGASSAVEFSLNGQTFFQRNSDLHQPVQALKVGEWYQVRVIFNLTRKTYTGWIASASGQSPFEGKFTPGWDGILDFVFIDSQSHLSGFRPSLDVDNFVLGTAPLASFGTVLSPATVPRAPSRGEQLTQLRAIIATAADRAQKELETLLVEGPFDLAYGVSEGTPQDARIQLRGEPEHLGETVPRRLIAAVGGGLLPSTTTGSGRLELANWLSDPKNPLTARVMVNRLWAYHFGRGLVSTPNDFGQRGQPPTHSALLDYLANRFVSEGWSIKNLHRLILHSAVYRQQSDWAPVQTQKTESVGTQPDCPEPGIPSLFQTGPLHRTEAHFSPFPRRRLGAEETRDSLLLVSGILDLSVGREHPFPPPTGWGFTQHGPFSAVYEQSRRSVYLMTQRIKRHPFLTLFDGPDPNASTAGRRTTTVPTQALFFLNDPFVHSNAAALALRSVVAGENERDRVGRLYRLTLSRSPTAIEQTDAINFLKAYRAAQSANPAGESLQSSEFEAFARILFGSNEFLTVD